MPEHHAIVTLEGRVTDLFGHRFVLETEDGKVLADLGPEGSQRLSLMSGDEISLTGDKKPSEVKVHSLTRGDQTITFKSPKDEALDPVSSEAATAAVEAAGYEVVGKTKRKPRHFEIIGRRGSDYAELHVTLDGTIRKTKPISAPDSETRA